VLGKGASIGRLSLSKPIIVTMHGMAL